MHQRTSLLVSFVACLTSPLAVACDSDSNEPPTASAGLDQGGRLNGGGASNDAGKAPSAGNTQGATGGRSAGGNSAGGNSAGGNSAGSRPEAGAPAAGAGGAPEGGGDLVGECLDAPIIEEPMEALRFEAAGVNLGIVRYRDPFNTGTDGSTQWLPQRFALVRGELAECVSDAQTLHYQNSHHNFADQMTALVDTETWIFEQTRDDYESPVSWSVEARNGQGLLWGPIALTLVSCTIYGRPGGAPMESCADRYAGK